MTIRAEVDDFTARLFPTQERANHAAYCRSAITNEFHKPIKVSLGYMIRNQKTGVYYDNSGIVPEECVEKLMIDS